MNEQTFAGKNEIKQKLLQLLAAFLQQNEVKKFLDVSLIIH